MTADPASPNADPAFPNPGNDNSAKFGARAVIVVMLVIAFGIAAMMIEIRRGRNAALGALDARLIQILDTPADRLAAGIPDGIGRNDLSPGDIHWTGRTWTVWLAAPDGGAVQIMVTAEKGIGPLPLFNGVGDHAVSAATFEPDWKSPFK